MEKTALGVGIGNQIEFDQMGTVIMDYANSMASTMQSLSLPMAKTSRGDGARILKIHTNRLIIV